MTRWTFSHELRVQLAALLEAPLCAEEAFAVRFARGGLSRGTAHVDLAGCSYRVEVIA
jgi:hypothetical protein